MSTEKTEQRRVLPIWAGILLALICGGVAGLIVAIVYFSPEVAQVRSLLNSRPWTQTQPTSTVQIIPVTPSFSDRGSKLPTLFQGTHVSPVLPLVKHASEGFVTKEQRLGLATTLTSDGWLVVPASVVGTTRLSELVVALNGKTVPITRGIKNTATDLVYLKIPATNLVAAALASRTEIEAGQPVWTETVPHQYLPQSIISLRAEESNEVRSSESLSRRFALSSSEPVSSAVWDEQGQLVGLVEGTLTQETNRLIPAEVINADLDSILASGEVRRASLGVYALDLNQVIEQSPTRHWPMQGAILQASKRENKPAVLPTGPAGKVLKEGDIIERIDRDLLDGAYYSLSERIAQYRPGSVVMIAGQRQNKPFQVQVTLGNVVTSEVLK